MKTLFLHLPNETEAFPLSLQSLMSELSALVFGVVALLWIVGAVGLLIR